MYCDIVILWGQECRLLQANGLITLHHLCSTHCYLGMLIWLNCDMHNQMRLVPLYTMFAILHTARSPVVGCDLLSVVNLLY